MKAVSFTNFSNEDFTWKYDGLEYTFTAGQTILIEDFKAEHFAQHLVDRELDKLGIPTNSALKRQELGAKCFAEQEEVKPLKEEQIEKKVTTKVKKVEKEFEDLEEKPNKK